MKKNLLLGASALTLVAFASSANADALSGSYNAGTPLPQTVANTIADGTTVTIDAGYSVDLTKTIDDDDVTHTSTFVVNGTVDTKAIAVGGTEDIGTTEIGSAGSLTIGANYSSETIDVNGGTLAASTGTITTAANQFLVTGTVNLSGDAAITNGFAVDGDTTLTLAGTANTGAIKVIDGKTLTISSIVDGATLGTIDGATDAATGTDNKGAVVFDADFDLDAVIGATNSLASVTVNAGKTLTADQTIKATNVYANGTITATVDITGTTTIGSAGVVNLGNSGTVDAVEGASAGVGTLNVTDNSTLGGAIGATNGIASIVVTDGKNFTTGANAVKATNITLGTAGAGGATMTTGDATITAAIDGDAAGKGILDVTGDTVAAGNIGATNSLASVTIGAGNSLDLDTNDVSLAATTITFANAASALEIGDKSVTGNIEGSGTNDGNVLFGGTGTVTGTIGATNTVNSIKVTGATTYAGGTIKTASGADIDGTFTVGADLTLVANADVDGTLNLGSYTVTHTGNLDASAGTVDAGTGVINTSGTLTTTATSNIKSTLSSDTAYGQIKTGGAATVHADTTVTVNVAGYVSNGTEFTIVDGTGGAGVADLSDGKIVDNSPLVSFTQKTTDNDNLVLIAARSATYETATTGAGATAGKALETDASNGKVSSDLNNVLSLVEAKTTSKAVSEAINELAPEVTGAGVEAALNASGLVIGVVNNRMEATRVASVGNSGVASGDEWMKGYGVWGQFFGGIVEQDKHDGIDGFDADTLGVAIGADRMVSDNVTLGAALSYANTDVDSKDASTGNTTEVDSYGLTVYGSYNNGAPWYVDGQLGFAYNDYEGERKIDFANRVAKASYDAYQYTAKVGGGYTYDMGATLVTPFVGLQYTYLDIDGYTETGAGGANLKVDSQDYNVLTSELGAKAALKPFEVSGWTVAPEVHASWLYDIVNDEAEVTATFTGGNTAFTTKGKEAAEHAAKMGLSVDVANGEAVTVTLGYDAELKEDYVSHTGALKLRYDF